MKRTCLFWVIFLCVFLNYFAIEQNTIQKAYSTQIKNDTPIWNVGELWRFRFANNREGQITVERDEGKWYVLRDYYSNERYYLNKKNLFYHYSISPQGKKFRNENIFLYGLYCDFPIYIGKKWGKMFSGQYTNRSPTNYLHEFKVLSYENVTVPAGAFNAYKIEFKRSSPEQRASFIKRHLWYSPEAKTIIKNRYIDTMEAWGWTTGISDFELVSLKLESQQWLPHENQLVPKEVDTKIKPQPPFSGKGSESKTVTPTPVVNMIAVTGTSANIRSGAGDEFPVITVLKQGDKLILLGEYGDWFNVRLENDQEGWINRKFAK